MLGELLKPQSAVSKGVSLRVGIGLVNALKQNQQPNRDVTRTNNISEDDTCTFITAGLEEPEWVQPPRTEILKSGTCLAIKKGVKEGRMPSRLGKCSVVEFD